MTPMYPRPPCDECPYQKEPYTIYNNVAIAAQAREQEREKAISKITTLMGFDDPDEAYQEIDKWRESLREARR